MSAWLAAYIIPFYGSWIYCVASYVDYMRNPAAYHNYPGGLTSKLEGIVSSVFGWLPFSLWGLMILRPPSVWIDSLYREAWLVLVNIVFGDIWFYSMHRLLHWQPLYWLHKKHHEAVNPVGILALYAHPFDAIIVNLGSMMIVHLVFGCSAFHIAAIGTLATVSTILTSHTANGVYVHTLHHRYRNCNYGIGLFMDRLLGTDRQVVP